MLLLFVFFQKKPFRKIQKGFYYDENLTLIPQV